MRVNKGRLLGYLPIAAFLVASASLLAFGLSISGCSRTQAPVTNTQPQPIATPLSGRAGTWILVDSQSEHLTLYRDGHPELVFENIAFGAAGVGRKSRRGDDVTPKGVFTVGWVNRESKYLHFIGLNYPGVVDAQAGLERGVIDRRTFDRINRAHASGATPPQDTALGGMIGIHGVGRGSMEIHRLVNWTAGCVAVDNEQIRKLTGKVHLGMVVEIR
jgi:murein L,D-transpeptidase YafK